jgi:hypothetical protein
MSNESTEVKSFFTRYEAANAIFDVEQIAACYAEVFMFAGPEGFPTNRVHGVLSHSGRLSWPLVYCVFRTESVKGNMSVAVVPASAMFCFL